MRTSCNATRVWRKLSGWTFRRSGGSKISLPAQAGTTESCGQCRRDQPSDDRGLAPVLLLTPLVLREYLIKHHRQPKPTPIEPPPHDRQLCVVVLAG